MFLGFRKRQWALTSLVALALAACNSGSSVPPVGNGAMAPGAPMSATSAMRANALSPISLSPGGVNGREGAYTPRKGDYAGGGRGQTVDGVPCVPSMVTNEYHVHFYLGVIDNGKLIADPTTIGMLDPGPAYGGFTNSAKCYYYIHLHDSSGTIHVELNRNLPESAVYYRLKTMLDIWGVPHSDSSFGPYSGPVHVFVGNVPLKQGTVRQYRPYYGNIDDIWIRSHEAIFIEIGNTYYTADQLPSVTFYTEY